MKIEESIQQQNFVSSHQKAMINILFTQGWLKDRISGNLKPYNITMQQYNVLRILRGQYPKGLTTSEIRDRMLDKMSDASRLVDRLEKLKLVEKKRNIDDRRLVAVKLSDQGVTLTDKIRHDEENGQNYLENLSDDEANLLSDLLDKIRD